jgi:hypothetical protein
VHQFLIRAALKVLNRVSRQRAFDLALLVLASARNRDGAQFLLHTVIPRSMRVELWAAYQQAA